MSSIADPLRESNTRRPPQYTSKVLDLGSPIDVVDNTVIPPQRSIDRSITDDLSSPLFLSPSDHPGLVLVSKVLNGTNYQSWKRGITMAQTTKNKIAFIDGSLPRPPTGNPSLNSWIRCNNMVMSWLVNSVSTKIAHSIMYFDIATDMWLDLAESTSTDEAAGFSVPIDLSTQCQQLISLLSQQLTQQPHADATIPSAAANLAGSFSECGDWDS
uniref:Retrotransposon Copia-like N-terminal domain-containing protein n=1 Tax=Cannabis sativa TaxID=3483 RepID=A0A803QGK2_CANSA